MQRLFRVTGKLITFSKTLFLKSVSMFVDIRERLHLLLKALMLEAR